MTLYNMVLTFLILLIQTESHAQLFTIEFNAGPATIDHFRAPVSYGGCLRFDVDPEWLLGINYHHWKGNDNRTNSGVKGSELYFGNNGANIQAYFRHPLTRNSGLLLGGGLGIYEMRKTNTSARERSYLQPALSLSSELYYAIARHVYINGQLTISSPVVYKGILITHPRWLFLSCGIGFII